MQTSRMNTASAGDAAAGHADCLWLRAMTTLRATLAPYLPLLFVAGCGLPGVDPSEVGATSSALVTTNGEHMNGEHMNGNAQNGGGVEMGGVDLTTMSRLIVLPAPGTPPDIRPSNLVPVSGVKLAGSMLTNGSVVGTQFSGAYVVQGWVTDSTHTYPATYYIEKVAVSANDPEIYRYQVRIALPDTRPVCNVVACPPVWNYACGAKSVAIGKTVVPYQATAIGGQWNYQKGVPGGGRKMIEQGDRDYDTKITFACENGAIGKCVLNMGYKPWAMAPRECTPGCFTNPPGTCHCSLHTLELMHEACVRMVRADYCGNGASHTVTGVSIDEWDNARIQTETAVSTDPSGFGKEAEWTPNGARCLSQALMGRLDSDVNQQSLEQYLHTTCGDKWGPNFEWADNDCFGAGPTSRVSTFDYANVPASFDWHNRVFIKNTSMCVTDRDRPNPYFATPPCLPMTF